VILPNSTICPSITENAYATNSASAVDNFFEEGRKHSEVLQIIHKLLSFSQRKQKSISIEALLFYS